MITWYNARAAKLSQWTIRQAWCWCNWSLKSLLKVVFRGKGKNKWRLTLCVIFFSDRMRERKNEEGVNDFSCDWWTILTYLLRSIRARKLHSYKCHGSVNFFILSNRSRLRVPLKLHRLLLNSKSNRHEHESARRPSELMNATWFVKNLLLLIYRDRTIIVSDTFIFSWFHKNPF